MTELNLLYQLFVDRGNSQYGGEAVTQREHALQTAHLAEQDGCSAALISAALLHDIGHLLHELPDHAPDQGIDDHHEAAAGTWLKLFFPPEVSEPVAMHVAAKRYLCAVETGYFASLSEPSITSLQLQGGPMSVAETREFEASRFCDDATRLRRWDDAAKVPGLTTPPLSHFWTHVTSSLKAPSSS